MSEFRNAPIEAEEQLLQMKKEKAFNSKMDELALAAPSVSQTAGVMSGGTSYNFV